MRVVDRYDQGVGLFPSKFKFFTFTPLKTISTFVLVFVSTVLCAQQWEDKTFKKPESLRVGMLDSVFIFRPEGVRLINVYANGSRAMKKELKRGDLPISRFKFDEQGRLKSAQVFQLGSYSLTSDRYVGFHTVTYEHTYPSSNETVIHYANTRELTQYRWFYTDSLLQECMYYRGKYPELRAFWKYSYNKDSLLTEITKYNRDTLVEYIHSYSYYDFGKVRQIQATQVGGEISFLLFECDKNHNLSETVFFEKLKHVPEELYDIKDGILVRKKYADPDKVKRGGKRWTYDYNEEGQITGAKEYSKSGKKIRTEVYTYNRDGKIERKHYNDRIDFDGGTVYSYNEVDQVTDLYFLSSPDEGVSESYTFEYDSRGNVVYCRYLNHRKGWNIRLDFEYEYLN